MSSKSENKTVTKANIVDRVYNELNTKEPLMTRKQSAKLVDQVFETIKDEIRSLRDALDAERTTPSGKSKKAKGAKNDQRLEKRLKISGFGNFIIRYKKSRPGRNPQNGETIDISSRYVLTFKPSQVLKKAINDATES